jgi:hypothetical protein
LKGGPARTASMTPAQRKFCVKKVASFGTGISGRFGSGQGAE